MIQKHTVAASLLIAANCLAQPVSSTLKFEVASVKEAVNGTNGVRGGCHGINSVYSPMQEAQAPSLGTCCITDGRLSHLIGIAFGVKMADLKTGPDWIQRGDLRFNVQAKAEDAAHTTEQQLLTMLQNLLVERFQLKFHYETTEVPGFALRVAKNGPKLQASQSEEATLAFAGPNGVAMPKALQNQPVTMTVRKLTMGGLVNLLGPLGTGPVLDKTGLTGVYDFTLAWDENAGPALTTALREQLGLSLEATKVPVSTLVVDAAQKPTPN